GPPGAATISRSALTPKSGVRRVPSWKYSSFRTVRRRVVRDWSQLHALAILSPCRPSSWVVSHGSGLMALITLARPRPGLARVGVPNPIRIVTGRRDDVSLRAQPREHRLATASTTSV